MTADIAPQTFLDDALSEQDKYYVNITLPMSVGEDSMTVERFLDEVWQRPLTHESLKEFSKAFWAWAMECDE